MSAQPNSSLAESLASLPEPQRRQLLSEYTEEQHRRWLHEWNFWARPSQRIPGTPFAAQSRTDWLFWLILAGRGFGKTRTGAETVRAWGENPNERILMIAPTAADVRDVMIEGESGLLACYPPYRRPDYEPSKHLVHFPSGALGITRSAEEPERLRGPQFTKFWGDEFCAWLDPQMAWDQIMFGFRVKASTLQGVITTTPKPIKPLKNIMADPSTVITRGSSYENRTNINPVYYAKVIAPYEGTRLGRQEINAELLEDTPGALWTMALIGQHRIRLDEVRWDLVTRIVLAIDPGVTATEESDETGMIVAAQVRSGHVLILEDTSGRHPAAEWAKIAASRFRHEQWPIDKIVAEVNNGGDLVERNINVELPNAPFSKVWASRGKITRAEPVATAYEKGLVHHVGVFPQLEEEMTTFVPGKPSPNRMDALVYAVTELLFPEPVKQTVTIGPGVQISPI